MHEQWQSGYKQQRWKRQREQVENIRKEIKSGIISHQLKNSDDKSRKYIQTKKYQHTTYHFT